MNGATIAQLSRESQNTILRAMLAEGAIESSRPKLTAYNILDKDMSAESLWAWYEKMERFVNRNTTMEVGK